MATQLTLTREEILATRSLAWPNRARALAITDQTSLELAADELKGIKALRAEIEETFGPIIKRAFEAHREAVAQRKKVEAPLEEAERIIKGNVSAYQQEQERLRREEERRIHEQNERREAEEREREIQEAELAGASQQEVEAIIERPLVVPPVVVPPTVHKVAGISSRETWKARVENFPALVKFVATNPQFLNLLQVNDTALNAMARGLKSTMNIPGVKVWSEAGIAVRR